MLSQVEQSMKEKFRTKLESQGINVNQFSFKDLESLNVKLEEDENESRYIHFCCCVTLKTQLRLFGFSLRFEINIVTTSARTVRPTTDCRSICSASQRCAERSRRSRPRRARPHSHCRA